MNLITQAEVAKKVGLTPNHLAVMVHRGKGCPRPSGFRGGWTKQDVQELKRWLRKRDNK